NGDILNREHPMANSRLHPVLKYLRRVFGAAAGSGVRDAELLRRFVAERDEAAFELLLRRHAAMVLHVCRQVLGDADAADDAFQATFLVFVRKAGSISRREALGSWLYRVAYRIALKTRQQSRKRTSPAAVLDQVQAPAESDDAEQRELRRIICEEVDRLPAKYRAAIVACFFEGKTYEEAALQLGWPRGTVAGRVARARELLHRRLLRRGVTLSVTAFAAALSVGTAQAALARLVDSLIHISRLLSAGQAASAVVSPHVAVLAEGVLQAMLWTRVKIVVAMLLLAGVCATGAALWVRQQSAAQTPNARVVPASKNAWKLPKKDADKWAERLRHLTGQGWTVSASGNDLVIQRDKPVRFADGSPNQAAGPGLPRLVEGTFKLTLQFAPKLSLDDYERLAAVNAASDQETQKLLKTLDLPIGWGGRHASTPEEKERLRVYREAVAKLPRHVLPDLYCPEYSIFFFNREPGWLYVYDKDVAAAECDKVQENLLRFFGMYDPKAAMKERRLERPAPEFPASSEFPD
ncbi:MAG: RNA polymerase sigma factor, partial [Gemmataceae bacterium]